MNDRHRFPALLAMVGSLGAFSIFIFVFSLSPSPRAPTVAGVEKALVAIVEHAPPPPVLDLSPAVLDVRSKAAACAVSGGLPDHACTPGAIFTNTTLEQICQPGYTKGVRSVSVSLKKKIYREYGIAYPQPTGSYEADHLIPLELGGSNDIANLFPEAAAPAAGFREKDLVENYLHNEACVGHISLPRAQEQIARDWLTVYKALTPAELDFLKKQYKSWVPN